jgi:signal peptidase II
MGLALIIASVIFFADFVIKAYLRNNLAYSSIPIIKNIFHITVVFNKGAAFGILQGRTFLLIASGIVFILFFVFLMNREGKRNPLFLIPCGLILGGAVSNLWDRIFLGFVVDYIDLRVWPVFNLSDSCITVGVGLLLWQSFKKSRHGTKNSS